MTCLGHTAPTPFGQLYASHQTGPRTTKTTEGTPEQTSCFPFEGPNSPTRRLSGPRPMQASPGPHRLPTEDLLASLRFAQEEWQGRPTDLVQDRQEWRGWVA